MNRAIYEQFWLDLRENLFIFIYLANEPNSSSSLYSSTKQVKLKHNNASMNKLVSIRLDL